MFLIVYSCGFFPLPIIPLFIISCIITSFLLSIWINGNLKERLHKTLPFAFPINTIAFVIGYFYETLKVL